MATTIDDSASTLAEQVAHLAPEVWDRAARNALATALAEFAHERLVQPIDLGTYGADRDKSVRRYAVNADSGTASYEFAARRTSLDHWVVRPDSIRRRPHAESYDEQDPDVLVFINEISESLGLDAEKLPSYLEEITQTVATAARATRSGSHVSDLVETDHQTIEAAMNRGHPCFVANGGRIGFDAEDGLQATPETAARIRLVWIAVHRSHSIFTACPDIDSEQLLLDELGADELTHLRDVLRSRSLDPRDFHLLPIHPWQWRHRVAVVFAADIARGHIVPLGESSDRYQPQQSVRTLANVDHPSRHLVKTALSVLNMGFMRGMPAGYARALPPVNGWAADLIRGDHVLASFGFDLLRECATVAYLPDHFPDSGEGSRYRGLLAAIWRESPVPTLLSGQSMATMAALLHVDRDGYSFAGALITRSELDPAVWLRSYLRAYLTPLLHLTYQHALAFMPHGENIVLVLENYAPVRAILKDTGEEAVLMADGPSLPPEVEPIRSVMSGEFQAMAILTDVFDGFFRHLAPLLADEGMLTEDEFWQAVAECVLSYQRSMPHLALRFAECDLFAAEFPRICLNRLQLKNNKHMLDLNDPASSAQVAGTLENPIARWAPEPGSKTQRTEQSDLT